MAHKVNQGQVKLGAITGQWRIVGQSVVMTLSTEQDGQTEVVGHEVPATPKALRKKAQGQERLARAFKKAQNQGDREKFQACTVLRDMAVQACGYLCSQRGDDRRYRKPKDQRVPTNRAAVRRRFESLPGARP